MPARLDTPAIRSFLRELPQKEFAERFVRAPTAVPPERYADGLQLDQFMHGMLATHAALERAYCVSAVGARPAVVSKQAVLDLALASLLIPNPLRVPTFYMDRAIEIARGAKAIKKSGDVERVLPGLIHRAEQPWPAGGLGLNTPPGYRGRRDCPPQIATESIEAAMQDSAGVFQGTCVELALRAIPFAHAVATFSRYDLFAETVRLAPKRHTRLVQKLIRENAWFNEEHIYVNLRADERTFPIDAPQVGYHARPDIKAMCHATHRYPLHAAVMEAYYLNQYVYCFNRGHVGPAIWCLENTLIPFFGPVQADYYYQLGSVHSNMNQSDRAIAMFQRAAELDPNHTTAHYALAEALAEQGHYGAASAAMRNAARTDKAADRNYSPAHTRGIWRRRVMYGTAALFRRE